LFSLPPYVCRILWGSMISAVRCSRSLSSLDTTTHHQTLVPISELVAMKHHGPLVGLFQVDVLCTLAIVNSLISDVVHRSSRHWWQDATDLLVMCDCMFVLLLVPIVHLPCRRLVIRLGAVKDHGKQAAHPRQHVSSVVIPVVGVDNFS
jgi:hypothetical protein